MKFNDQDRPWRRRRIHARSADVSANGPSMCSPGRYIGAAPINWAPTGHYRWCLVNFIISTYGFPRNERMHYLVRQPPAKERGKGREEEPDIEAENDHTTRNGCPRSNRFIHQVPQQIAATRKHNNGYHEQRQDETMDYLDVRN